MVKTLVELGADKEASAADGSTPLHAAAGYGHVAVVKTLAELGADIGALNRFGETPLQVGIRCGHHQAAQMLKDLERSVFAKKEAAAERMAAQLIKEEEREQAAQRKVRDCSTLTLAELHGTRLNGVSIAHGLSAS